MTRGSSAKVERSEDFEGALLGWENMEDAKRKLQAHGPALVHDHHVVARATPVGDAVEDAPVPTATVQAVELKERQATPTEITSVSSEDVPTTAVQIDTNSRPTSTAAGTSTTAAVRTSTPSPTSAPEPSGDGGGDNVGMKAGIALGVLGGLLIIGLIIYLVIRKRRNGQDKKRRDEKHRSADEIADRRLSTKTSATAPRLSLRPVTQFFPGINDEHKQQTYPDRRASKEAAMQLTTPGGTSKALPAAPGSKNPFRDSAERPVTPRSAYEDIPPVSPVSETSEVHSMVSRDLPSPPVSPEMARSSLVRSTSVRNNAPKALDLTLPPPGRLPGVPPSPTGTEYSFHSMAPGAVPGPSKSAAAIADAGGPAASTVHRVQLDFKPTLDDELGLKAGQLVRLLHEYDDGWALCIRLDRSQQGVVPRTCLSTRPVKPRPNPAGMRGPPVNPSSRPGSSRPRSPPAGVAKSAPGTAY